MDSPVSSTSASGFFAPPASEIGDVVAQIMKMGKSRGSKKSSKAVRKENRPYHGDRSNTHQHPPAQSQSKHVEEGSIADTSEEEGEGQASQMSWTQSASHITSEEDGIIPFPAEDKSGASVAHLGGFASGEANVLHPGHGVPQPNVKTLPGNGSNRPSLVTPAQSLRPPAPVPGAPRVLGNSQRENCPQRSPEMEPPASSYLGILSPPRKFDQLSHPPAPGPDYFDRVPDEVLLHVLHFLTRRTLAKCLRVCKKWYRIGSDEMLWRRVDLSEQKVQLKTLKLLFCRGSSHLRLARTEITENFCPDLNSSFSGEPSMSRLQYLDLSMAVTNVNILSDLLSHCRQLKKVSLEHVDVNDTVLHLLSENPFLDTLNLAMCHGVTSSGLMPLFAHCSALIHLNLAWTNLDSRCVSYVCGAVPVNIKHLNISGCREAITDTDVHRLCVRCRSLKELDLSDSPELTGVAVDAIRANLSALEELSLSRCYKIYVESLKTLGSMQNLKALNVITMLTRVPMDILRLNLSRVQLNCTLISSIARPTTGSRCTSIWEQRMREV